MRSFMGRDILSLKCFEREEFFRVFQVAQELAPLAGGELKLRAEEALRQGLHRGQGGA